MAIQQGPDFWSGLTESQQGPFGVANQFIGDIDERRQNRLLLAMKSAIIEKELMAAQQKEQFERSLKSPTFAQTGDILKTLGAEEQGQQLSQLPGQATPEQAQQIYSLAKTGLSKKNNLLDFLAKEQIRASNRPKRQFVVNADGRAVRVVSDPVTGKELFRQDYGASSGSATRAQQAAADFETANAILSEASDQITATFSGHNLMGRVSQFADFKLNQLSQDNAEQAALLALLEAMTTPLARGLGDVRVSDQDKEQIRKALPDETDTVETALKKLKNFKEIFEARRRGAIEAFSSSIPQLQEKVKREQTQRQPSRESAIIAERIRAQLSGVTSPK